MDGDSLCSSRPWLPASQPDGYFVNADGSFDIYTRHATYFALLSDTQAPSAPRLTGQVSGRTLRLTWGGARDNVRVTGYVVSRNGVVYRTSKRTVLVLPLQPGRYRVVALDRAGNKSKQSTTITVVRQKNGAPEGHALKAPRGAGSRAKKWERLPSRLLLSYPECGEADAATRPSAPPRRIGDEVLKPLTTR